MSSLNQLWTGCQEYFECLQPEYYKSIERNITFNVHRLRGGHLSLLLISCSSLGPKYFF